MSILNKLPPIPIPRVARFLAVIAIAMAAGHLVQTLAARKPAAKALVVASAPKNIVQLSAGSTAKAAVIVPQTMDFIMVASTEAVLEQKQTALAVAAACPIDLALTATPSAMIGIRLVAPCHAEERVVLRHAGLAVTARLGADGTLRSALPALMTSARVEILFSDGNSVDGALQVADAAALRRFGVQWQGPDAFVVHGLENGADYGQPGDISPGNLGRFGGGSLVLLGDASVEVPLLAQVYTFPTQKGQSAEVVFEAAVTEATCGSDLLGETISSHADKVVITDLTLTMPDCSGIGDFLVLKNLASDMKIAAN
jgi:hypothetical protein